MKRQLFLILMLFVVVFSLVRCQSSSDSANGSSSSGSSDSSLSGSVKIDGSSTVFPISQAVAEDFKAKYPNVEVAVAQSGTGGGFKKFSKGEIDISDASRPIKPEEAEECKKNGVEYIEIPIAFDALAVVVNPKNDWVEHLTVEELKRIWEPAAQGKITNWSQVRPNFPDKPLKLFGAGVDSGTFDYFTAAIVGEEDASRGDFTASEDDNILVQGVAGDAGGLGFFGIAYFEENQDKLRAIPIDDGIADNGDGPQHPTADNVISGVYQPLARPIFIYVNKKALDRLEVKAFVEFYIENMAALSKEVGYVPLPDNLMPLLKARFEKRVTGSAFGEKGSIVGVKLEDLYKAEEGQ